MNTYENKTSNRLRLLLRNALIAALYVALTMLVAPVAFGAVQFRISETLNFLCLYNPSYIIGITIGVIISNYMTYGMLDMIVGGLSTLIFLWLGEKLANITVSVLRKAGVNLKRPMIVKYIVLIIVFSLSMFTIALMLAYLGEGNFWPNYLSLLLSEAFTMTLGAFIMYPIGKRIDLS